MKRMVMLSPAMENPSGQSSFAVLQSYVIACFCTDVDLSQGLQPTDPYRFSEDFRKMLRAASTGRCDHGDIDTALDVLYELQIKSLHGCYVKDL